MLASSTSIEMRLRKNAMMIPRPTAASAAATLITIKTKSWPVTSRVITRKRDKRQVDRVQHQLDAHEHADRVSFEHNADRADGEQNARKRQISFQTRFHNPWAV